MGISLEIDPIERWGVFKESQRPYIIAGPCSAESEEQLFATASHLKDIGISVIRAGIWKPRSRPGFFEGAGSNGLKWLQSIQNELGLKIAIEVANTKHVEAALKGGVDILWIGARTTINPFNVQEIANALKGTDIPVMIKNPMVPDLELWFGAIERILFSGISRVAAIHRGFSAYKTVRYRNAPHWQIPIELKRRLKSISVFCDPSHIGGDSIHIAKIAQEAMDLEFDGLMIESHIMPQEALSDAKQQVTPEQLKVILEELKIRDNKSNDYQFNIAIEELREKIDNVDNTILQAITDRMNIIEEIGEYKKKNHIVILQSERWDLILTRVKSEAIRNNLDPELIEKIFKTLHQASIDRQNEIINS